MNKIMGWALLFVCSLLLLVFALTLSFIFPEMASRGFSARDISPAIGFVIAIVIFGIGLRSGIKIVRKPKTQQTVPYEKELNIEAEGRVSYSDYRNLILSQTFKKPGIIVLAGLLILSMMAMSANAGKIAGFLPFTLAWVIFWSVMIISILKNIKKNFQTNKMFSSTLHYKFDNRSVNIDYTLADTSVKWDMFVKIQETNNFFLL